MYNEQLQRMLEAGKLASQVIMDIYNQHAEKVEIKDDDSPVTQADKQSDKIIREYLQKYFPTYGLLSEETSDDLDRLTKDYVFIIDPIDGTKDYISHDDEFAINIALSYKHEIVVGVIFVPAKNEIYYAVKNEGAFLIKDDKTIKISVSKNKMKRVLRSRHHTTKAEDEYLNKYQDEIVSVTGCGSSYKGCKIASGEAELNFKLGDGTKEWDVAPIDIIVKEAGGIFTKMDGTNYSYNRKDVHNHEGFIILNEKNENFFVK